MGKLDLMLEAERRGILPDDKKALLAEARRRGLIAGEAPSVDNQTKESKWSDVPGEALRNIPRSALEFGKSVVSPLVHPVKTVEGIGRLIAGGGDLLTGNRTEEADAAKGFGQFLIDRYGSEEGLKKTISKDPVGFAADISTILTAGGSLAAKAPGTVGKMGAAVRTAGESINPVTIAGKAVGAVTKPASDWLGDRITESVFKLPVKTKLGKREEMVSTIQEYGIQPSKGGWQKVKDAITTRNQKAKQLMDESTAIGGKVPISDVTDVLDDVAKSFENTDLPKTAAKIVERYKKRILAEGKTEYTVNELNVFKKKLDDDLKPMYVQQIKINPGFRTSIIQDAKKSLADRVRDILYDKVQGLEQLNMEQSRLLKIEPYVQEAANRVHNWNAVTLYDFLIAGGAYAYNKPLEAMAAAVAWRVIRSPQMQQLAARGLVSGAQVSAKTAGNVAIGARSLNLLSPRPEQD